MGGKLGRFKGLVRIREIAVTYGQVPFTKHVAVMRLRQQTLLSEHFDTPRQVQEMPMGCISTRVEGCSGSSRSIKERSTEQWRVSRRAALGALAERCEAFCRAPPPSDESAPSARGPDVHSSLGRAAHRGSRCTATSCSALGGRTRCCSWICGTGIPCEAIGEALCEEFAPPHESHQVRHAGQGRGSKQAL